MDRRQFVTGGAGTALAASWMPGRSLARAALAAANPETLGGPNLRDSVGHHRFGVNYTPSHNWWFCWNDWKIDPIKRDLDAIAALGADHLRIMLVWPDFQPNLTWVSNAHLERLGELLFAAQHVAAEIGVKPSRRGQSHGALGAVEQDHSQTPFHLLHVLASRGLTNSTMLGALTHAARGSYLFEKSCFRERHQTQHNITLADFIDEFFFCCLILPRADTLNLKATAHSL